VASAWTLDGKRYGWRRGKDELGDETQTARGLAEKVRGKGDEQRCSAGRGRQGLGGAGRR
jgi:hypothetical protein